MSSMITLALLTLLIDRDSSTKVPVTVFDYERAILEELHGEELVYEVSAKDIEIKDFDVQKAYEGLKSKYQRNKESEIAFKRIYPNVRDLARRVGIKAASDKPVAKVKAASDKPDEGKPTG